MIYLPRGAVTTAYIVESLETYVKQVKKSENYLYAHNTGVASRAIDDIPLQRNEKGIDSVRLTCNRRTE